MNKDRKRQEAAESKHSFVDGGERGRYLAALGVEVIVTDDDNLQALRGDLLQGLHAGGFDSEEKNTFNGELDELVL